MKNNGLTLLFILAFLMNINAQDIWPDTINTFGSTQYKWEDDDATVFYNYQGTLYMFDYRKQTNNYYFAVYMYDHSTKDWIPFDLSKECYTYHGEPICNEIRWGYYGENLSNYSRPIYSTFAYEYNGRLWFCTIIQGGDAWDTKYEECYAELDLVNERWNKHHYEYDHTNPPEFTKRKGIQMDTTMWFYGTYDVKNTPNYEKLGRNVCQYDSTTNSFTSYKSEVVNIQGERWGSLIKYLDGDTAEYLMMTTLDKDNNAYLYQVAHGIPYKYLITFNDCAASTIIQGTIKAQRTQPAGDPQRSYRFAVFNISSVKGSDGKHAINYHEYSMQNNKLGWEDSGNVLLQNVYPIDISKNFYLQSTFDFIPNEYSGQVPGIDGMQQQIWLFFVGDKKRVNGFGFLSDIWRPVEGSAVNSIDLNDDRDTAYGKNIRNLWTLVGIIDGPPPCSIDWETWNSTHPYPWVPPTILNLEHNETASSELVTTSGYSFSYGDNLGWGIGKYGSASISVKYTNGFEAQNTLECTTIKDLSFSFDLDEDTQAKAFYIYSAPQINRVTYKVYPWWQATGDTNELPNSVQYLFRNLGSTVFWKDTAISEFPFLIDMPNAPDMADWKMDSRQDINSAVLSYSLGSIASPTWENGSGGQESYFETDSTAKYSFTHETTYDESMSVGVKIPLVFQDKFSAALEGKYSSQTTATTQVKSKYSVSLANLYSTEKGVNIDHLYLNTYWFTPTDHDWWYYRDMGDQKPWYIAYIVTSCKAVITPKTPINQKLLKQSELVFSWEIENQELENCSLFISTSPQVSSSTIVYRADVGNQQEYALKDFIPEEGVTYYWSVRGFCESGDPVWSDRIPFEVIDPHLEGGTEGDLKASIYPNPVYSDDIHIIFDTQTEGNVKVSLFDLTGRPIIEKDVTHNGTSPTSVSFPSANIKPGVYIVVINTANSKIAKKVIVAEDI